MWLVGVVIRRYIDILIIIINIPYSTCIYEVFFGSSILTSLFIFKMFFRSLIYKERKNIKKINKEAGMLLPKRANTSGVGKINNYCEDM